MEGRATSQAVIMQGLGQLIEQKESPFVKRRAHFEEREQVITLDDNAGHHSIARFKKKFKERGSKKRNENPWIKINTTSIKADPATKKRANELIVALGEIFRFELGDLQPKYRIVKYEDGATEIVSKEIKNSKSFYSYYNEVIEPQIEVHGEDSIYPGQDFPENMGRSTLLLWLYGQDDLHFNNARVIKVGNKHFFIPIDFDRCAWTVMHSFHNAGPKVKLTGYKPLVHQSKLFSTKPLYYQILEKKSDNMGEITAKDFKNLLLLESALPTHWSFMEPAYLPFVKAVLYLDAFHNEKHFAAFRVVATTFIREFILKQRLTHPEDLSKMVLYFQSAGKSLSEILSQDVHFLANFNKQYMNWMQITLFEVHQFFKDNKHYTPLDKDKWQQAWQKIAVELIEEMHEILKIIAKSLTPAEVEALKKFASACFENGPNVLDEMRVLYESQGMTCRATMALDEWIPQFIEDEYDEVTDERVWSLTFSTSDEKDVPKRADKKDIPQRAAGPAFPVLSKNYPFRAFGPGPDAPMPLKTKSQSQVDSLKPKVELFDASRRQSEGAKIFKL